MNNLFNQVKKEPEIIKNLIKQEREDIEFKSKFWWETGKNDWYIECAKDIVSMANRGGGIIIIGIDGESGEIKGVENGIKREIIDQNLARVIQNNIEPKISIEKEIVQLDNKELFMLEIPDVKIYGPLSLVNTDRDRLIEFWVRRVSHKKPLTYGEVKNMFFENFRGSLYKKKFLEEKIDDIKKIYPQRPLLLFQSMPYNFDEENKLEYFEDNLGKVLNNLLLLVSSREDISKSLFDLKNNNGNKIPAYEVNPFVNGCEITFIKDKADTGRLNINNNGYIDLVFYNPLNSRTIFGLDSDFSNSRNLFVLEENRVLFLIEIFINFCYEFYSFNNINNCLISFSVLPHYSENLKLGKVSNGKWESYSFSFEFNNKDESRYLRYTTSKILLEEVDKSFVIKEFQLKLLNMFGIK